MKIGMIRMMIMVAVILVDLKMVPMTMITRIICFP